MIGPAFTLDRVTFRYRSSRPPVLVSFSRRFSAGLTLLCGPSGGGKSTLLKLLAGFLVPNEGNVLNHRGLPPDGEFLRREIGFVFQQFNLLPSATLRENLVLSGTAAHLEPSALNQAIDHWIGRMDLRAVAEQPAGDLSGGQVQRAALARALIKSPPFLLLDEPTSGLDEKNTRIIAGVLDEWRQSGRTVIVSTHDPRLSGLFADAEVLQLAANE